MHRRARDAARRAERLRSRTQARESKFAAGREAKTAAGREQKRQSSSTRLLRANGKLSPLFCKDPEDQITFEEHEEAPEEVVHLAYVEGLSQSERTVKSTQCYRASTLVQVQKSAEIYLWSGGDPGESGEVKVRYFDNDVRFHLKGGEALGNAFRVWKDPVGGAFVLGPMRIDNYASHTFAREDVVADSVYMMIRLPERVRVGSLDGVGQASSLHGALFPLYLMVKVRNTDRMKLNARNEWVVDATPVKNILDWANKFLPVTVESDPRQTRNTMRIYRENPDIPLRAQNIYVKYHTDEGLTWVRDFQRHYEGAVPTDAALLGFMNAVFRGNIVLS